MAINYALISMLANYNVTNQGLRKPPFYVPKDELFTPEDELS